MKAIRTIFLVVLFLFSATLCNSQNVVTLLRSLKNASSVTVCRSITVPTVATESAVRAAMLQSATRYNLYETNCRLRIELERKIVISSVKSPTTLYGPYNYLRAYTKISKDPRFLAKNSANEWKNIYKVQGFNGVHHIISKGTIKLIYEDLKKQGKSASLIDMENNAPAIFHPLHGNPEYTAIFHNLEEQYANYKAFGMKVTILRILERIDALNVQLGKPKFPDWYIKGVLTEAELWCKYHGLVWETP